MWIQFYLLDTLAMRLWVWTEVTLLGKPETERLGFDSRIFRTEGSLSMVHPLAWPKMDHLPTVCNAFFVYNPCLWKEFVWYSRSWTWEPVGTAGAWHTAGRGEEELNGVGKRSFFSRLKQGKIPSQRHGVAGRFEIWVLA